MDSFFDLSTSGHNSRSGRQGPISGGSLGDAEILREDLRHAQARIDKLSLTCQALWEILRDNTGLSDEMLLQKVSEIDLRDGKLDGKQGSTGMASKCENCGRPLHRKHQKCLYCGHPVGGDKRGAFAV